jgi:CTP synthase
VIPHVTDEIKRFVLADAFAEDGSPVDFVLVEIGGTVGDIEGLPFFEAIRQVSQELPRGQSCFVHLTLLPFIKTAGEMKTKPTQHSVKELRSIGIQPDILLCRCEQPIPAGEKRKIGLFCNVRESAVIQAMDAPSIYAVPLDYHREGLDAEVLSVFGIKDAPAPDLSRWQGIAERLTHPDGEVNIAVVGKYTVLKDAYKSLIEALVHGGVANNVAVNIDWVESEQLEADPEAAVERLENADGVLVPGAFGERGAEGMIRSVQFAREHEIPYFGICFGLQVAVIEAARNLAGLPDASTSEFGPTPNPLVGLMTEWVQGNARVRRAAGGDLGGTMRLGAYDAILTPGSKVAEIYGGPTISERHRHRYEVNIGYREAIEGAGLKFSGMSPDGVLPELVEREDHPWFVGVQFHPELKSRPFAPHPLFASFIAAAKTQSRLV